MTTQIHRALSFDRLEAAIRSSVAHPLLLRRARPFSKTEHHNLAQWVIALANVSAPGSRFIVFGVTDTREFCGVNADEFVAVVAAVEALESYIEPMVRLNCFNWQVDGATLAVVAINACDNPPYLVARDMGALLRAGDGWLRRDDCIRRLVRRDYERFYSQRFAEPMFSGAMRLQFASDPPTEIMQLAPIEIKKPPSRHAVEKIEALIAAQELVDCASSLQMTSIRRLSFARVLGSDVPYEAKSIAMLRAELQDVESRSDEHDASFKFEHQAHPVNFQFEIDGDQPIRAATLVLHIPANVGLEVSAMRQQSTGDHGANEIAVASRARAMRPRIQTSAASIRISTSIDILKPGGNQLAFDEPLRIYVDKRAVGYKFPIRYELRARNLARPCVGKLFVVCLKSQRKTDF